VQAKVSSIQNRQDYSSVYFNLYVPKTADGKTKDIELHAFSEFNLLLIAT
jgi:hypothetical protein